jgi:arsenite-transporting ATPase
MAEFSLDELLDGVADDLGGLGGGGGGGGADSDLDEFEDANEFEAAPPTLQNIMDSTTLKWVFVGGKGGVGKTTTSCCLALLLAQVRESVLVISTDPAHNLSDAFGQKFTRVPTKVKGYSNLSCMEVDPSAMQQDMAAQLNSAAAAAGEAGGEAAQASSMASMMGDITSAVPGVDEAMSFAEIMKNVQTMSYDIIVFDTAPTGHTLRLLNFPNMLEKAFSKLSGMFGKFSGLLGGLFGGGAGGKATMLAKLDETRKVVEKVNRQFKDASLTTFVCVCIPEFLSLYETERLVQELGTNGMDVHNVVVNQVLYPDAQTCHLFNARARMQRKYLDQIYDLYGEEFNCVSMPLLENEVRGVPALRSFADSLLVPYVKPVAPPGAYHSTQAKESVELRAEVKALKERVVDLEGKLEVALKK